MCLESHLNTNAAPCAVMYISVVLFNLDVVTCVGVSKPKYMFPLSFGRKKYAMHNYISTFIWAHIPILTMCR